MPTHKKTESERFKGPAKWCQYVLARAVVSLLQRLPITFAFWLGRKIGWLCWKLMSRRRVIVAKNLKVVNAWMDARSADGGSTMADSGLVINDSGGQINDSCSLLRHLRTSASSVVPQTSVIIYSSSLSLEDQVKEVFQRAGANLFAGFTFARMKPEEAAQHIEIEGLQPLRSALAEGKGAIILLAHMGPWEALAQIPELAQREGITAPFGAMYRPLNNTYLDDWIQSQREAKQTQLFSRRDGFHKPVDFLRGGGMLGILADQKMREGPSVDYFGQQVHSSPIPGLFHRRSGSPLFALSVVTLAPAQWRLSLLPVPVPESLDLSQRESLAQLCNEAIAGSLAQSPLDGFWLHKRF